jgi:hypothetical protein
MILNNLNSGSLSIQVHENEIHTQMMFVNETFNDTESESENEWFQIRAEYISGSGPKFLSEKFNIPVETIRSRIKREGWNAEKKETREATRLRVREVYTESLCEIQVEAREEYRQMYSQYRKKLKQFIDCTNDPKEIILLIKAVNECQQGEFKCLGISDEVDAKLKFAIDPRPIQEDEELAKRRDIEVAFMNQLIKYILAKYPDMTHEDVVNFFAMGDGDKSN